MIKNYFQIALRNLLKNRVHTVINVMGLSFGMASVFLITVYILYETSFDTFHHDAGDLYRITWVDGNPQTRTPHPMAQALATDFPEVESAVSLSPLWSSGLTKETHSFHIPSSNKRYDEKNILAVDTTFFKVFDFKLIKGDPKTALKKLRGVLISESMAAKYFGDEDPIGKQLAVDSANYLVDVVGVFEDVPANAHFHFDFLVSYLREKSFDPNSSYYQWKDFGHYNYIRLRHNSDPKALEAKLMTWSKKYFDWTEQDYASLADQKYGFKVQPVKDIHLKSRLHWELEPNGNIEYIYILGAAGLFTLVIACVNFMNLTTAKSAERAKEIGVRKTMGAFRYQLSLQFLAESVSTALIAAGVSVLLIELSMPFFNYMVGHSFEISYLQYLPVIVLGAAGIGLMAGIYPAMYLSGVNPHLVLKGKLIQSPRGARFRKILIISQFSISMMLISSAIIIFNQLSFIQHKNLGFAKEEVIVIPVKNEDGMGHFDALRNELLRIDGIIAVSASSNIPGQQFNQHSIALNGHPDDAINSSEVFVDYDFFKTLGIQPGDGRTFLRENPSDTVSFVLNETAAKQLDRSGNIIGKELLWKGDGGIVRGTIIGTVKDFHFQSLHDPIRPLVFFLSRQTYNHIVIKMSTSDFPKLIASVENTYKQFETTYGFEFAFLDQHLERQYRSEEKTANILAVFSIIAVLIASFGLFGMSMMLFYQKVKEVSVRKVLGATSFNLLFLLLGDFTRLVFIAIVLATPLTWFIMNGWMKNFTYQVGVNPVIFATSGVVLIIIAWSTMAYFTFKATRLNPAETLKNE